MNCYNLYSSSCITNTNSVPRRSQENGKKNKTFTHVHGTMLFTLLYRPPIKSIIIMCVILKFRILAH